ncbi:hypothetical protein CFAM422_003904 [Trichoderma lentiforme]|uniref:Uncharacterized protein n=1 Tax=Trichoderma lentiforme TaxID=1567552 RepID=A0A9P4XJC0_9HYPO|nr:hypothetical protein CFAM422_003904 [Trichoderma lentiforme]
MNPGIRLLPLGRGYATQRPASRLKPTISLDHPSKISPPQQQTNKPIASFSNVQKLWHYTEPSGEAQGALQMLGQELNLANMHETSLSGIATSKISYLLSTGKTEWESMERYIGGM